jgi:hypothetical protein
MSVGTSHWQSDALTIRLDLIHLESRKVGYHCLMTPRIVYEMESVSDVTSCQFFDFRIQVSKAN